MFPARILTNKYNVQFSFTMVWLPPHFYNQLFFVKSSRTLLVPIPGAFSILAPLAWPLPTGRPPAARFLTGARRRSSPVVLTAPCLSFSGSFPFVFSNSPSRHVVAPWAQLSPSLLSHEPRKGHFFPSGASRGVGGLRPVKPFSQCLPET